MGNNLIPLIAERLGVQVGEEFDVNVPYMGKPKYYRYKLTNDGLLKKEIVANGSPLVAFSKDLYVVTLKLANCPSSLQAVKHTGLMQATGHPSGKDGHTPHGNMRC